MKLEATKAAFTKNLLRWNKEKNRRRMPWKGEKDPYKIWLSEIILQQTRVEQGFDYYQRFVKTYPSIEKLARATDKKIFKLWEGLGYYSRCKNLIATARVIAREQKGRFPDRYEEILSLKGVGPYTAAAIASFAFNLPYAVVDGNVFRVLSRFFGIQKGINTAEGKKLFSSLAASLLDKNQPGIYNQAIMDFGAVICKPQSPLCKECPLIKECVAFGNKLVDNLPVTVRKPARKKRWLYYFIIEHNGQTYVRRRGSNDIWENLYEFILLETMQKKSFKQIQASAFFKKLMKEADIKAVSVPYVQHLSHQTIEGAFIHAKVKKALPRKGFEKIPVSKISQLAFPRFITRYLQESGYKAFER